VTCEFGALHEGSCYLAVETSSNPTTARGACEAMGGFLATIESGDENAHVRSLADALDTGTCGDRRIVWIGLSDREAEGSFIWDEGVGLDYTNWADGEPNADASDEDWVEMVDDGTWNDKWAASRCYVCETYPTEHVCDHDLDGCSG